MFLLVASYVFYGWWDWRFLSLLAFSSVADYLIGLSMVKMEHKGRKKLLLALSLTVNLGLLGFFKYFNFFQQEFVELFASFGIQLNPWSLKILLPVGISFYTFQTLSYTIDVYRGNLKPTKDPLAFFAYVSFFPQLVAGPIERAKTLLPQLESLKKFSYQQGAQGLRLVLWGLFKKIVIADSLAPVVNDIFSNYETFSGGTLLLGAIYFAFQIYCDFSGYSDMAIGIAKLFGIELMSNFRFPYFSRDIAEFWRRWHISLSTWFRDYLYFPLGGSRGSAIISLRNIMIVFLVSGFWHGANWTFIVWGAIHALLYLPLFLSGSNRKNVASTESNRFLPSPKEALQIGFTFTMVTLAWVFFRAESITDAVKYLGSISFTNPVYKAELLYPLLLIGLEWPIRTNEREPYAKVPVFWFSIIIILLTIFLRYSNDGNIEFIYFQF